LMSIIRHLVSLPCRRWWSIQKQRNSKFV